MRAISPQSLIAFTNKEIFGASFYRTSKTNDVCAVSRLFERGIVNPNGTLTLDLLTESESDRSILWQFLRYLWSNNTSLHPFDKFTKPFDNSILVAKNILDAINLNSTSSITVREIASAINTLVTNTQPRFPYLHRVLDLVLNKLSEDAKYLDELPRPAPLANSTIGFYAENSDGNESLLAGVQDAQYKVIVRQK